MQDIDKWYPVIVVRCQHCKGTLGVEVLLEGPRKSDYADVGRMVVNAAWTGRLIAVETCSEKHTITVPTCHCRKD